MKKQWIQIHPNDAVAVALEPLGKGQTIVGENFEVTLKEDIPQGHKFTLHPIKKGEALLKYGHPIGEATQDIDSGSWVHTHNMKTRLNDELTYEFIRILNHLKRKIPVHSWDIKEKMEKLESETKSGSFQLLDV